MSEASSIHVNRVSIFSGQRMDRLAPSKGERPEFADLMQPLQQLASEAARRAEAAMDDKPQSILDITV